LNSFLRSAFRTAAYGAYRAGVRLPAAPERYAHLAQRTGLLARLPINVVLDVGANEGWFSQRLRWAGFQGRIISFEPIPSNQRLIEAKADPNWLQCNYALGERCEVTQFNVLSDDQGGNSMSSFLRPTIGVPTTAIDVQVQRLDDVLPGLLGDVRQPRIFVKLDTQGFDIPVLCGAAAWMPKIFGMQSEVSIIPIYERMTPYTEALALYHSMGFELIDLQVVSRTETGAVREYDCLMAKQLQPSESAPAGS